MRNDPDSLLALIADLRRELEHQRRQRAHSQQVLASLDRTEAPIDW